MGLSAADLAVLRDELTNDPLVRGYAGMSDQAAADRLNVVDRERNRISMTADAIFQNIDLTEWAALQTSLTAADNAKFVRANVVLGMGEIDPFGQAATVFTDAFGAGSATIIALQAARKEPVSRAVERGLGVLGQGDVEDARQP